jgi:hypothetical protein
MVATKLARGVTSSASLDNLLGGRASSADAGARESLVSDLMRFAGASPERLGARGALLVTYDPYDAVRSYNAALRVIAGAP